MTSPTPSMNTINNVTPGRSVTHETERQNSSTSNKATNIFQRPQSGHSTLPPIQTEEPTNPAIAIKTRPQFIIKRVNTEEIFPEPVRMNNYLGLHQINEENTGEFDDALQNIRSIDLDDPKFAADPASREKDLKNMFKTEMVTSQKYKEYQKGPLLKNGLIVKHSICGSVEGFRNFEKYHKKFVRESHGMATGTMVSGLVTPSERGSITDLNGVRSTKHHPTSIGWTPKNFPQTPNNQNLVSSQNHNQFQIQNKNIDTNPRPPSSQGDQPSVMSSTERLVSAGSSLMGKRFATAAEKKQSRNTDLVLNKDQVVAEITQIRVRQVTAQREEDQKTKGLSLNDKLLVTKETRVLQKCENETDQFQKRVDILNAKVGREGSNSVMLGMDDHRQKKEMAEILDIIKTDEERYGSKFWYKTLRKHENGTGLNIANFGSVSSPQARAQTASSAYRSAHRPTTASALMRGETEDSVTLKTDDDNPATSVEYIRKPRVIQTPAEAGRPSEKARGRTEKEYLDNRISSRKHIVKVIKPMEIKGLDGLIVQGQNKFHLEAEAIMNQVRLKDNVVVPKNFYSRNTPVQPEEIFEKKSDKSTILRYGLGTVLV